MCRELTKLHEQVERGSLAELAAMAGDGRIPARGEVVLVVGWGRGVTPEAEQAEAASSLDAARAEVDRLVADGMARGEAAKHVAAASGHPRRALYGASRE